MVTASQLNGIGSLLVDIHGQSDHLSIPNPDEQRRILIDMLVFRNPRPRQRIDCRVAYCRTRAAELNTAAERSNAVTCCSFRSTRSMKWPEPEDDELKRERDVLQNADELRLSALSAVEALTGEASELMRSLTRRWSTTMEAAGFDSAQPPSERATEILVLAEDSHDIRITPKRLKAIRNGCNGSMIASTASRS